MNTRAVAEAIGTNTKTLRAFLRADPRYANVGSSGRYDFPAKQIPVIKRRFLAWAGDRALVTTRAETDGRAGLPPTLLERRLIDRGVREQFDRETQIRMANLHTAMRAAGLTREPTLTD